MKKSALSLILSVSILYSFAQGGGTPPLAKGEKEFNFGAGISDHGIPVYGSMDIAIKDDITVGPEVHLKFDDDFRVGVLVKGDYHFNRLIGIPSNWDFYAGARLGVEFGNDVDLDLGGEVGGRWFWSDKWGLNAEFSGGTGFGTTVGLTMKM